MLKKILVHSFIYALAPALIQLGQIILLPFTTPHLTAADFGIFGVILSYTLMIQVLRDLGFNVLFVNTFYRYPRRWPFIWRMLYGHLIYWSIIYLLLLSGVVWLALPPSEMHRYFTILLLVAVPALIFENTAMLGGYYYRFSSRPVVVAMVVLAGGIASLGTTYYFIVERSAGYMGWIYGNFASALTMFILYAYPMYGIHKLWPALRFRRRFIRGQLRISLPMIPHNLSSYLLTSSDRVMMDLMKIPIAQIGLYNAAYRCGNYLQTVGEAIGMAVGPQYTRLYIENSDDSLRVARKLTFILMTMFLAGGFLAALWLREIFIILFRNPELQPAYAIGIIILMAYVYRPMYWCSLIRLSAQGKTGLLWRVSFTGGVINVVLNLLFLKSFGIIAAAIAAMISLLYIGFAGFYLKSFRESTPLNHYPLQWIGAIILTTAAAYLLRDSSLSIKALISLLLISVGLFAFRYLADMKLPFSPRNL